MNNAELYQKLEEGSFVLSKDSVDLRKVIEHLARTLSPAMKEKYLHFRYKAEKINTPDIIFDERVLNLIVRELIRNAINFTPDGGDIILSVSEIGQRENKGLFEIYVQDNGIGMPEEFRKKLFRPYTRRGLERTHEGEGLGLAVTKKLVDLIGGKITCESGEDMGSIFRVVFSAEPDPDSNKVSKPGMPDMQRDYYNFDGKNILLVEDHPLNRLIASDMLKKTGCHVMTADNGEMAVESFKENEPDIDLILMDIRMPVMDGIEATKTIRKMNDEKAKEVPIIALTASAYEGDIHRSSMAGMNESVLKPIDPKKLYSVMAEYLFPKQEAAAGNS